MCEGRGAVVTTLIRYREDGEAEVRPLEQADRDALFGPMFSLPENDVWWKIENMPGNLTRIKLWKADRSTANVPTLDITASWDELIEAVSKYIKQYKRLNGDQMELPL